MMAIRNSGAAAIFSTTKINQVAGVINSNGNSFCVLLSLQLFVSSKKVRRWSIYLLQEVVVDRV